MTKETKKQVSPINNANSNVNLKTHLTLALKNTSSIMKVLLPKIAVSVKDLIIEYKKVIPHLIKAVQELSDKVAALEAA